MSPDVIVIGSGIAGVSAALSLKKRGKRVLVLTKNGGATSVSSGSFDFGPITDDESLEALRETPAWQTLYEKVLVDAPELARAADLRESAEALATDLDLSFNFRKPYTLPTSSGKWKKTFGAQAVQAKADLNYLKNKKIGFVGSQGWRFRADVILKSLAGHADAQGSRLDASLVWVDSPSTQADWPLPHVAARFQGDAAYRAKVLEALSKKVKEENFDTLLFPPFFLEGETLKLVQKELGVTIAETLCGPEPIAGHRLQKNLERLLQKQQIDVVNVSRLEPEIADGKVKKIRGLTKKDPNWQEWESPFVVLATGKYFGGGVHLGYQRLSEPVFELPLFLDRTQGPKQYRSELDWRDTSFRDEQPWAKLGLWLDSQWRPQLSGRAPALRNVVAAGSLIAGVDFARENIGLGFFAYSGRQCTNVLS